MKLSELMIRLVFGKEELKAMGAGKGEIGVISA